MFAQFEYHRFCVFVLTGWRARSPLPLSLDLEPHSFCYDSKGGGCRSSLATMGLSSNSFCWTSTQHCLLRAGGGLNFGSRDLWLVVGNCFRPPPGHTKQICNAFVVFGIHRQCVRVAYPLPHVLFGLGSRLVHRLQSST